VTRASLSRSSVRLSVSPGSLQPALPSRWRMGSAVLGHVVAFSSRPCACPRSMRTGLGWHENRAEYDAASDTWTLNGRRPGHNAASPTSPGRGVSGVGPDLGVGGQAFFIVPPKTPGLAMGRKFQKMVCGASTPLRSFCTT